MNVIIWIIQGFLALAFFMAGFMKITMPKDKLKEKIGGWVDDYKVLTIKTYWLIRNTWRIWFDFAYAT